MAKKQNKPAKMKMDATPIEGVRNPNFDSALAQQDYMNTLAQLVADRQARGEMPGLMPVGGTSISAEQMQNLSPERRQALEEAIAMQKNIPQPNPNFYQSPNPPIPTTGSAMPQVNPNFYQAPNPPIPTSGSAMPQANPNFYQIPNPPIPTSGSAMPPVGQMNPMANYNQMLQQGMQRNADMNQAGQNLVGMSGPARSFSQVAGGTRRMNRMPRQPRNNSLAPSNQKLI